MSKHSASSLRFDMIFRKLLPNNDREQINLENRLQINLVERESVK